MFDGGSLVSTASMALSWLFFSSYGISDTSLEATVWWVQKLPPTLIYTLSSDNNAGRTAITKGLLTPSANAEACEICHFQIILSRYRLHANTSFCPDANGFLNCNLKIVQQTSGFTFEFKTHFSQLYKFNGCVASFPSSFIWSTAMHACLWMFVCSSTQTSVNDVALAYLYVSNNPC